MVIAGNQASGFGVAEKNNTACETPYGIGFLTKEIYSGEDSNLPVTVFAMEN